MGGFSKEEGQQVTLGRSCTGGVYALARVDVTHTHTQQHTFCCSWICGQMLTQRCWRHARCLVWRNHFKPLRLLVYLQRKRVQTSLAERVTNNLISDTSKSESRPSVRLWDYSVMPNCVTQRVLQGKRKRSVKNRRGRNINDLIFLIHLMTEWHITNRSHRVRVCVTR